MYVQYIYNIYLRSRCRNVFMIFSKFGTDVSVGNRFEKWQKKSNKYLHVLGVPPPIFWFLEPKESFWRRLRLRTLNYGMVKTFFTEILSCYGSVFGNSNVFRMVTVYFLV